MTYGIYHPISFYFLRLRLKNSMFLYYNVLRKIFYFIYFFFNLGFMFFDTHILYKIYFQWKYSFFCKRYPYSFLNKKRRLLTKVFTFEVLKKSFRKKHKIGIIKNIKPFFKFPRRFSTIELYNIKYKFKILHKFNMNLIRVFDSFFSLNPKFLTKFIRLNSFANHYSIVLALLSNIQFILLSTSLLSSIASFNFFLKNSLIFINNCSVTDAYFFCKPGDFIELYFNNTLLVMYFFKLSKVRRFSYKLRSRFKFLNSFEHFDNSFNYRKTVRKLYKISSITNTKYLKFYEVDFFSQSCFFIFNNSSRFIILSRFFFYIKLNILPMYN